MSVPVPEFIVILPAPVLTLVEAVTVIPFKSVKLILPPPELVTTFVVNGVLVLVKVMSPLEVFEATNVPTALFEFKVVPPTEVVVNVAVVNTPAPLIVPPAVKVIAVAALIAFGIAKLLLAPVFVAVKLASECVPPITPPNVIVPAPEFKVKLLVPVELLSVVPIVKLPPVVLIVLLPLTVTVPKFAVEFVVPIVALIVVDPAVCVTPLVKVNELPPLPNVTNPVFAKVTALVIVFEAPVIDTAKLLLPVTKPCKVTLPTNDTFPVPPPFCIVKTLEPPSVVPLKVIVPEPLFNVAPAPIVTLSLYS